MTSVRNVLTTRRHPMRGPLPSCAVLVLLSLPLFAQEYTQEDIRNRHTTAFPLSRLQRDWIYQDHGLKHGDCFVAAEDNEVEHTMVRKVLGELASRNVAIDGLEKSLAQLVAGERPGNDPAWKSLYFRACELRRRQRLKVFDHHPREFVYGKHFVFGDCQAMFAMTDHLTDAVFRECGPDYRMNSQLCKMTIRVDGTVSTEVLLDCPEGVIRDPCVSYDGSKLAFSMRRTSHDGDDDFHLYVMNLTDRSVRQITFGAGTADMEPEWLPDGELVFTSTRCVFSAPCWWSSVCNLFTCDAAGRYIRRLAVDHGHTVFPHMTDDGRIIYTRWEYADRTAGYLHSLFVMNPDGTNQTEFYGNNSQFPAAILHARSVPRSTKVIAIAGAHHIDQRGKLIMIDRNVGIQAGVGINHLRSYPRVTSNSHYRYRPEFSPNNVIDGRRASDEYWRPARRTDLWLMIEFGREIQTERVVLVLHQREGQEKTWNAATLEFSNGEKVPVTLKNTPEPQEFAVPKQTCEWVRLIDFQERFPLADNGIVEFEVYGKDLQY